jgi:hypothetical protein
MKVQVRNPMTKKYVLIDKDKGLILGSSKKPYKGITIVKKD